MAKHGKMTLNEIMGKRGDHFKENGLELHDLPELLGERMPSLQYDVLGRHRLINALHDRFGANYRNVPGVQQVLKKFDEHAKREVEIHLIKKRLGRK